jgi:hypothetical protein
VVRFSDASIFQFGDEISPARGRIENEPLLFAPSPMTAIHGLDLDCSITLFCGVSMVLFVDFFCLRYLDFGYPLNLGWVWCLK